MNKEFQEFILDKMEALSASKVCDIQALWSGYGVIARYQLENAQVNSIVVKHISFPNDKDHPRGWNTDFSHQRKLKSYQIEMNWYANYSKDCVDQCYVPQCYGHKQVDGEALIILEDLDASGFEGRVTSLSFDQIDACLKWLAYFHAIYLNKVPQGLWDVGTYWHLDTRPDELEALDDVALKQSAKAIDQKLNDAQFKTFVHGDAKLANFCFSKCGKKVAAVDFQYIGGGCGMKDVAYFIGSCLHEQDCEYYEDQVLDTYFKYLKEALEIYQPNVDVSAVVNEWRLLYPVAWTDFHRFIKGWSPGHWKINNYSERVAKEVMERL